MATAPRMKKKKEEKKEEKKKEKKEKKPYTGRLMIAKRITDLI